VLASARYIEKDRHQAEYFSLIMLATSGMIVVAMAVDLISLFVGLETASLSSYALVAFRKRDKRGAEAAVKYLVIGGMSSALSLYGISLLYGITGTTNLEGINSGLAAMSSGLNPAAWLAIAMLLAGFGFKVAIVPFHQWAPDVYEGAPTPISGLLAAGSKKMGMVLLFKVFLVALIALKADWQILAAILAILTMTIGNVVALQQTNIKRMLAYSSIGQAGYMIIAIAVASQFAVESSIFHIITHAFMKGGAFMVVAALSYVALGESIADYKGLGRRAPLVALSMGIFLFALAGIPPLSGFWSKVFLFSSAIDASQVVDQGWMVWLAIAGILNSALSLYYYARVVKYMFVDDGPTTERLKIPLSLSAAIAICLVATIAIGIWPEPVIDLCEQAARALVPLLG
jgi:NADH-quinone oxidoreductase subunit N